MDGAGPDDNVSQAAAVVGDVNNDGHGALLVSSASVIALLFGPASNFPSDLQASSFMPSNGIRLTRSSDPDQPAAVTASGEWDLTEHPRDIAFCDGNLCRTVLGPVTTLDGGIDIVGLGGPPLMAGGDDVATQPFGEFDSETDLLVAERDLTPDDDADKVFVLFGGTHSLEPIELTALGDRGNNQVCVVFGGAYQPQ